MDYAQAVDYIKEASERGIKLGLDRMKVLMEYLGNPQDSMKFIHVAGTNGKGSLITYLASVLMRSGFSVGQYTSPYVATVLEQYRINGRNMSANDYSKYITIVAGACKKMEEEGHEAPTAFEIETAAAFLYFKNYFCDIVLLEAGMGGETDATNIVNTVLVSVITVISEDHLGVLGNSIEEIARKKAGIIKCGVPVVMFRADDRIEKQIIDRCKQGGSELYVADPNLITNRRYGMSAQYFSYKNRRNLAISMGGDHQIDNAALALEVCDRLISRGLIIAEDEIREGLAQAKIEFRMEKIMDDPLFIIDGAHNPGAVTSLRNSLAHDLMARRMIFIIGIFKDKDYKKICEIMGPMGDCCIAVETKDNKRALPKEELAECLRQYCDDVYVSEDITDAVRTALERAKKAEDDQEEPLIVAFGSLSYLGELKEKVKEIKGQE
ncbi:MAG: bifunctional folylpolyglutamate synthase/dihydrofolate synthase [Lachnospiraceae bacterium]|nr:bifunctional folylpolyglutamate synthase/dihydrofolate synthase [Lachnospiraceae bacterium]